jgi:hypothetical protein
MPVSHQLSSFPTHAVINNCSTVILHLDIPCNYVCTLLAKVCPLQSQACFSRPPGRVATSAITKLISPYVVGRGSTYLRAQCCFPQSLSGTLFTSFTHLSSTIHPVIQLTIPFGLLSSTVVHLPSTEPISPARPFVHLSAFAAAAISRPPPPSHLLLTNPRLHPHTRPRRPFASFSANDNLSTRLDSTQLSSPCQAI